MSSINNDVSVIITIRDREPTRIDTVVNSLRMQGGDYDYVLVDYGSTNANSLAYRTKCEELSINYIFIQAEGLPWNKCRAINCGVLSVKTRFIVTTDLDILYTNNPVEYCIKNIKPKEMYHAQCYWIPQNGTIKNAVPGGFDHPGGFQFLERSAFELLNGYDESLNFWGMEDWDWPWRLEKMGFTMVWLPDPFRIYHVWHEPLSDEHFRPQSAIYETYKRILSNSFEPKINQTWGLNISEKERPILKLIAADAQFDAVIDLSSSRLDNKSLNLFKYHIDQKNSYLKVILGQRLKQTQAISRKYFLIKFIIKFLFKRIGFKEELKVNTNLDFFYAGIPVLQENGLIDFYLNSNNTEVLLLFKC